MWQWPCIVPYWTFHPPVTKIYLFHSKTLGAKSPRSCCFLDFWILLQISVTTPWMGDRPIAISIIQTNTQILSHHSSVRGIQWSTCTSSRTRHWSPSGAGLRQYAFRHCPHIDVAFCQPVTASKVSDQTVTLPTGDNLAHALFMLDT